MSIVDGLIYILQKIYHLMVLIYRQLKLTEKGKEKKEWYSPYSLKEANKAHTMLDILLSHSYKSLMNRFVYVYPLR